MRERGAIAPNDAERQKTMRKYEVDVPENVEMADIQAIQTRIKKHNLLTTALLIPLFASLVLSNQHPDGQYTHRQNRLET